MGYQGGWALIISVFRCVKTITSGAGIVEKQ